MLSFGLQIGGSQSMQNLTLGPEYLSSIASAWKKGGGVQKNLEGETSEYKIVKGGKQKEEL